LGLNPLSLIEWSLLGYVIAAILSITTFSRPRAWNYSVHTVCAVSSGIALGSSIWALVTGRSFEAAMPLLSIPLPKSVLYLDTLSAFIIMVVSLVSLYTSIFAVGYVDHYYGKRGRLAAMGLNYSLFLASMILVALAGDAVLFIIAWEIMSITSFFLVLTEHERPDVRRAAFVYMVYASISVVFIAIAFGIGYYYTHTFVFIDWSKMRIPAVAASAMFVLFFIGFSSKAGIVPLHSWLPQAHPAAPSHVSALLSGVMVKLAMYGLIRTSLYALAPWVGGWWAAVVLAFGALSAFYGIAYATIQRDVKKLLAYSTIENIGIISLGIGAALAGASAHIPLLTVLGLAAALFHILNHALSKSQLFLCSGALLHQLHTRNLEEMGGLVNRLRATAIAFLVAALGISGMPFFNCFASEWLTYNSLLQTIFPTAVNDAARFLAMIGFITLAAAGALAVYCFTKAFGAAFLGAPRSREAEEARPEPRSMKASYVLPTILIAGIGLFPALVACPLATSLAHSMGMALSPLATPGLGMLVVLWRRPSLYIPIVVAAFTAAIGFIAWARSLARTVVARRTIPFISGVEYDQSLAPSSTLYAGDALDTMASFYGVRKVYRHEYAVRFWTSRRAVVERWPIEFGVRVLRALGMSDDEIRRLTETADDFLQIVIHVAGKRAIERAAHAVSKVDQKIYGAFYAIARAVTAAARAVDRMDRGIYGGMRGIARGFAAWARGVRKIQIGSIYVYLVYIYIALILILIYYVVVR